MSLFFFLSLLGTALSQNAPTLRPEQDCFNALAICRDTYVQNNSYVGEGEDPNEIGPTSCLGTQENNDVWYILTVQEAGDFCFTITPNDPRDDYDWAVFNLTEAQCADIRYQPELEVSCNFSPNIGCNGETGPSGQTDCARQMASCLPVEAGETYVINVSNYSETNSGYTLDMSASTAVIYDNQPPQLEAARLNCARVEVTFSENVACSSLDTADFHVQGPPQDSTQYRVVAMEGGNCELGGSFSNQLQLTLSPAPLMAGTYTLEVVGEVYDNCRNVMEPGQSIEMALSLGLEAVAMQDTLCQGESTQLAVRPAGFSPRAYAWFPGGHDQPDPMVRPDTTTTYYVGVRDSLGCVHSGAVTVTVKEPPQGTLVSAQEGVCLGEPASLYYEGDAPPDLQFSWKLDGGERMAGYGADTLRVRWSQAGLKTIQLEVADQGCVGPVLTQNVAVSPPPSADFVLPEESCQLTPTTLVYAGRNGADQVLLDWDFDGGLPEAGLAEGAGPHELVWHSPGTKEVTLIASQDGCSSTPRVKEIYIHPLPRTQASLTTDSAQCLADNAFGFAVRNQTPTIAYRWEFGDGQSHHLARPTHTFSSPGTYTVSLQLRDIHQCETRDSLQVEVLAPPTAAFGLEDACVSDSVISWNASQAPPGSSIRTYAWTWGDGQRSALPAPAHRYRDAGTYVVQLTITSSDGCSDTLRQEVTVHPLPELAFTSHDACEGEPVLFEGSSTEDGIRWQWDFDDGSQAMGASPAPHLYPGPGLYEPRLSVQTERGCHASVQGRVEIFAPPAAPTTTEAELCRGDDALLTALAPPGSFVRWFQNEQQIIPFHEGPSWKTPPLDATHTYLVQSVSAAGCLSQRVPLSAYVHEPQTGGLWVNDSLLELPQALLQAELMGGIPSRTFQWDFGDGHTSEAAAPSHEYQYPGRYELTLNLIDLYGCHYEFSQQVQVSKTVYVHAPTAFSPNGDGINDRWYLRHHSIQQVQVQIFSRHGQRVFVSRDPNAQWNGLDERGRPMPEGVYVFSIQAVDVTGLVQKQSGTLILIR